MEQAPRSPANARPNSDSRRVDGGPKNGHYGSRESVARAESNQWDWILNDNDRLRQLVDQARRASVDFDPKGQQRKPNLALANLPRGPASQAHGWLRIAVERKLEPELERFDLPADYSRDPVEQSLLWLILNFDPQEAEPEIVETVELLAGGQLREAFNKLDDYICN